MEGLVQIIHNLQVFYSEMAMLNVILFDRIREPYSLSMPVPSPAIMSARLKYTTEVGL